MAIQPSTVTSKWFGDSVRYVKAAFSLAAKLAPCVLFVDEVCIYLETVCIFQSGRARLFGSGCGGVGHEA